MAATADSPKLAQAGRFSDTEARLLGVSDRHLHLGWLARTGEDEVRQRREAEREQWQAEAAEQAARELAEQEAKAAAHRAEWTWWERTDEELLGRLEAVLPKDTLESRVSLQSTLTSASMSLRVST